MIAKEFVVPKWVKKEDGATDRYARFVVEPFERGYGTTIGNALRRVLLASLAGSAVTALRIEGIQHEFSAIPGIREDLTTVVLNFKRCQLRLNRDEPIIFSFSFKGQGEVTAGQIFKNADVEVFNPELAVLTSVAKSTNLEMEIKVAHGRGYVTAENFELEHAPLGTIYLDASFSPVTKVNFQVEDARVGQTTDYDRLLLDVWTNGAITPDSAVQEGAGVLIDHFRIFVSQESEEKKDSSLAGSENDVELMVALARPVDELELSVRASHCLKAANIRTIADLVVRTESEMLQFPNFGKKSLDEIKCILESMGLDLGMKLPGFSRVSVDEAEEEVEIEDEE